MKHCVYVELDAILDTRLAVISSIDQDAAVKLLRSEEYYTRAIDDFSKLVEISKEQFEEAYLKRDKEILKQSRLTKIPLILDDLISKMEMLSTETPFVESLKVELNVWPYKLDEEERSLFASALMAFTGIETLVDVIYKDPETLTPSYIKGRYTGLILYNFRDWLKYHTEAFMKVQIPTLTILAPAIFKDTVPTPDDYLATGMDPNVSPFTLAEVGMASIFGLNLIDVKNYCILQINE